MNIKAEKIEQIIQIVNRNLLLVFAGQISGSNKVDISVLIPEIIYRYTL